MNKIKKFIDFINESYTEINKRNPFKILDNYNVIEDELGFQLDDIKFRSELYKKGSDDLLAYVLYEEDPYKKVHISHIESVVKNKGYGQILMIFLAKKYGYQNLERSNLTESGKKMRKRLDDIFNFDYEKFKKSSKHLSKDVIDDISVNNPDISMFITMLVNYGNNKKTIEDIKSKWNSINFNYEFNDIYELSKWIRGSKTNKNNPNIEPPRYIIDKLNLLV